MSEIEEAAKQSLHPFNAESLDFPSAAAPKLFYVICSTPRCGSTYLAREMWLTGCLGAPHEYFNYFSVMLQMSARLGARTLADYSDRLVRARTGPNGVFGFKLHFDHFTFFRTLSGQFQRFRPMKFIVMRRAGLVEQAVSNVIAIQTSRWTSSHDAVGEAVYSRDAVDRSIKLIMQMQRRWDDIFERTGTTPYRLDYEDFCRRPGELVGEIADHLGVVLSPRNRIGKLPPVERQGDPIKAEWVARYNAG